MVSIAGFKSRQEIIEVCMNEFKNITFLDSNFNYQHQLVLSLFFDQPEITELFFKAILAEEIRQKYKLQTQKHKTIFKKLQNNGFRA